MGERAQKMRELDLGMLTIRYGSAVKNLLQFVRWTALRYFFG